MDKEEVNMEILDIIHRRLPRGEFKVMLFGCWAKDTAELTFELAWKAAKTYLGSKAIICGSPRECFAEAFRPGLIADNPLWLKMIEDKNLSGHTYNEKLADEIYGRLLNYLRHFSELRDSVAK